MRFFIHTLGCKVNQYESQALREAWLAQGMSEAASPDQATLILVHSCAVTSKAVAESRGAASRLAREASQARIVVCGCAARTEPEAFKGCGARVEIIPKISEAAGSGPADSRQPWPDLAITGFTRARPVIKIQDGCSHGCAFCVVPRAKGPSRSRPYGQILAEAQRLLAAGHRELIISGINLSQFVLDSPCGGLWDLLARLERDLAPAWSGLARLRLSSLDPGLLTSQALDVLAGSAMLCRHLHISLQSADPGVLKAMGREHYDPTEILNFLAALGLAWPVFGLGADLLTGFPGESEEAYVATLDFCRQARLSHGHVFPYSRRPGTIAAKIGGQLRQGVKKARAAELRALIREKNGLFLERLAGLPRVVLAAESLEPLSGVCEYYVECRVDGSCLAPRGALVPARPLRVSGQKLMVEAL